MPSTSKPDEQDLQTRSSRQSQESVDWSKCLFCQECISGQKLHNIECFSTSNRILKVVKLDSNLRCLLSGVSDLIATEGKYHLKCYVVTYRKYKESDGNQSMASDSSPQDICFYNVMQELKIGLAKGGIFSLITAWERFLEFLKLDFDVDPGPYRSNRF